MVKVGYTSPNVHRVGVRGRTGEGTERCMAVDLGKLENRSNQVSKVVFSENPSPRSGIDLLLLCFLISPRLHSHIQARNVFVR